MQPETEGKEEKGPSHIPYINDPGKRPHPGPGDDDPETPGSAEPDAAEQSQDDSYTEQDDGRGH